MNHQSASKPIERYMKIFNQLPSLFWATDLHSRITLANNYYATLAGYHDVDSILGTDHYSIRCPAVESADDFIAQDQVVIQTGEVLTILDIHTYIDNIQKILITKKSPLKDSWGVEGSVGYSTEIQSDALSYISGTLMKLDAKYHTNRTKKERCYTVGTVLKNRHLTKREMNCVFYLLRGYTMKQIANKLSISPRTVEKHIEKIKSKCNCYTKSQVIEYALNEGYLNYIPDTIMSNNVSTILNRSSLPCDFSYE